MHEQDDKGKGESRRIAPARLRSFVKRCYEAAGLSSENADTIADLLVKTELHGVITHGVIRVPSYIARLQQGGHNPQPDMQCVRDAPAMAVLCADNAPGHLAGKRAMEIAIEKSRKTGVGAVAVTQSDHFGANGTYAMIGAEQDMVSLVWSNSFPIMSAWGGFGNHLTNAPFAFAVPAGRHAPILVDMAVSQISTGAVRIAARLGEKLSGKLILDSEGYATDDPNALLTGGSHMSIGAHKGYNLAIIAEILSGVLAGGPFLSAIPLWDKDPSQPSGTGHFVLALNIRHFIEIDLFKTQVDAFIDEITSHPPRPGFEEVRVPGESAARKSREYSTNGIPVNSHTLAMLNDLALDLGVAFDLTQ